MIEKTRLRPLALVALTALVAPALSGCASMGGGGAKAVDTNYVARDVNTLYSAAKDRLDRGRFKESAALFDEVERQHPYSPWARRAQLMSAFSYYMSRDYNEAINSAQRFLSIHPGNKDAPYAYYLIALSYYEQMSDVTRDQKITQSALQALGEVARRYPNTDYAADARLKMDLVNDHLAGKEMEIGRYYERSGKWLAAALRFRDAAYLAVFLWAYTGILLNHTSKSGFAGAYPGVIAMAAISLAAFAAVFVTLLVAPGLRVQRKPE